MSGDDKPYMIRNHIIDAQLALRRAVKAEEIMALAKLLNEAARHIWHANEEIKKIVSKKD